MNFPAPRIIHLLLAVSLISLESTHAQTQQTSDKPETQLTDGLVLSRVTQRGRIPLHRDPVEALLLTDSKRIFAEGDSVELSDGSMRSWESVTADENGRFSGRKYAGSYLQFVLESEESKVMLLDAHGHGTAVINGDCRGGDTYNWWHLLPFKLNKGSNRLLFHVGRGQFRGKLVAPEKPVYLAAGDHTLPDIIRDTNRPAWAAMPIINASTQHLSELEIHTSIDGQESSVTNVGSILPLTLRKVGFEIRPPKEIAAEEVVVSVKLVERGQTEPLDSKDIKLQVRDLNQRHRRTFVSRIDGSVQYYAVTPAKTDSAADAEKPGLYLSLHGAGVEAAGQAAVYQPKSDGHLVAPTNRRSFGFDWEDWGRADAMEVMTDAMKHFDVDPQRIYLTGHSMGGHGTWQIGATYPDRFAAIGPSAGWVSFWSYAGGKRTEQPTPIVELFERAANPSDTLQLAKNYASQGVYVLHGDKDNNVPVTQARKMRSVLGEFHPDFAYFEQPGAGHWWGNACCDWPPMFEFFRRHRRPKATELNEIDFTTICPGISDSYGWASIVDQTKPLVSSRIKLKFDRSKHTVSGATENVSLLSLDLTLESPTPPNGQTIKLDLDEDQLDLPVAKVWLSCTGGHWRAVDQPSLADKGPHRYGLFKSAFDNQFALVYGTSGTEEENHWAISKVRYDAETFWYRGNGSIDIVADHEFKPGD